jgi:L-arabinose isomerase
MKASRPLCIGLFGIGLGTYWPQFPGLESRLKRYLSKVSGKLKRPGVQVVNLGLVHTPEKALEAGHIAIAQGKTKVRPLQVYHGKVGCGLSVEMSVKHGPVTLLSVVETKEGRLKLLVAEGESVPGPILEIGNTNSRYRFSIGARRFVNDWNAHAPAHHCAIGVGQLADKIDKLGRLLGIEVSRVC